MLAVRARTNIVAYSMSITCCLPDYCNNMLCEHTTSQGEQPTHMTRVVCASSQRTGSTLLNNLVIGFLCPFDEDHHWDHNCELVPRYLVTKTHHIDVDDIEKKHTKYRVFFVMGERVDRDVRVRVDARYKDRPNVLVVGYDEINETQVLPLETIVDQVYDKFQAFFPSAIATGRTPVDTKQNMMRRVQEMNIVCRDIASYGFAQYCDNKHGVHGGHRRIHPGYHLAKRP